MRKYISILILLLVSIVLAPFSYSKIYASEDISYKTIYPENILDYTNLTNISKFSINDNYIVYTLDQSTITLFNKNTREYSNISGFNNILKIKATNNKILVADYEKIRVIDLENIKNNINDLYYFTDINLTSLKAIDLYISDNKIFIGTITDKTFKLYQYDLNLNPQETNPIKTSTFNNFDDTRLLTINNNNAYIVYGISGLCIQNYTSNEPIIKNTFKPNATIIDTFYYNNIEYLATFTNEILYLLSSTGSEICNVNIESQDTNITDHFPIQKVTDIDFYNNKIHISDSIYKTIQSFDFISENNTITDLLSKEIILSSSSNDKGRFNSVNNIYLQGSKIFTTDAGNNRIHYLENNQSKFINIDSIDCNPHSVLLDKYNNLFFIKDTSSNSILCKYKFDNDTYTKLTEYNQIGNESIGYVSDMCVTNSNSIFLLDYTNDKLIYLSNNSLETKHSFQKDITPNSQIQYLKALDLLVVLDNSSIQVFNQNGQCIDWDNSLNNCTEIIVDLDKIYARIDNKLKIINIENNEIKFQEEQITLPDSEHISSLTFDIVNRKIYGFDTFRSCLVTFDCNISPLPFDNSNINNNVALNSNDTLLPLKIKYSSLIYDYPYEIGNYYNNDESIEEFIGIGEYEIYYKILFNHNNTLKIGYIPKANVEIVNHTYKAINVITTHQSVPVYKYPTLLKYNDERIIIETLDINTKLTLSYIFPISIDDKSFYLYKQQDQLGFIFSVDIVLDESTNIQNLNTENASIKILDDSSKVYLLAEDKSTIIYNLNNATRIYVENFDKNQEYTYVIYKDSELNTYQGYVETKHIQMDNLDNADLILVSIIVISILLLICIAIAFIVIKRKNK